MIKTMVRNLTSPRTDNAVANQFVIETKKGSFFQSYSSLVAKVDNKGVVTLSQWWDYSNTTRKYLYQFLKEHGYYNLNSKAVRKLIKDKEFKYKEDITM